MSISIIIGFLAFIATLAGGLFAIRFKDKLHLILGFSAGAVVAVAFFEIIPEAIELASQKYEVGIVTLMMGAGFTLYMLLDRVILLHSHTDDNQNTRGILGAGALSLHSFLDGIAIGLAFQASTEIGMVVTSAVLAHDFSDGLNTANIVIKNGGKIRKALSWVLIDAFAPVLGVLSTSFFSMPGEILGLVLAVFAGDFIYIGASDMLPESHHRHPKRLTTVVTLIGMAVIFGIVRIIK